MWENKCVHVFYDTAKVAESATMIEGVMNKLGAEGWEFCFKDGYMFFFKKKINEVTHLGRLKFGEGGRHLETPAVVSKRNKKS